ncbi:MAG: response regulator transcription factor [Beutenbergiaceae bacterium]
MNARPTILLVDDEEDIRTSLGSFLQRSDFEVMLAADGEQALEAVERTRPDVIVLDVLMPKLDGRSVVRRLRAADDWIPIVLLTQVGESIERSLALEEGADDYLNKPFDPGELLARVRAVLRRSAGSARPLTDARKLSAAGLVLDRAARRCWVGDQEVVLTPKAAMLLDYLMTHPDELHTREHLLEALWGFDFPVSSRAVDHRIAEIRRALGDDPAAPTWIETAQALGYRFIAKVDRA